jgi:hypothetical protein
MEEYATLVVHNNWDLVPHPLGSNVVTSKWVFRHKFHADNSLERYKARWVCCAITKQPGIDYDRTFNLVVKPRLQCPLAGCRFISSTSRMPFFMAHS